VAAEAADSLRAAQQHQVVRPVSGRSREKNMLREGPVYDAIKLVGLALVLGLVAMAFVFHTIRDYQLQDASGAAFVAGFPFFGVALLAHMLAIKRRGQPDARVINSSIRELVRLLVLSGVWVFVVLLA